MIPVPFIPVSAPFTAEQRAWLNGYLAGLFSYDGGAAAGSLEQRSAKAPESRLPLLILFGSQTGTAEQLAQRLGQESRQRGFEPRVLSMAAFETIDWAEERLLAVVTSTWGDGDPPDNAVGFWNFLNSEKAPALSRLGFSVLALGDRNYADFCGAGKKFDARLEELGAKRLLPRADCDTDYEPVAKAWMDEIWPAFQTVESAEPAILAAAGLSRARAGEVDFQVESNGRSVRRESLESGADVVISAPEPRLIFNRQNPFPARLMTNRKLNAPGSAKDTRHFEISLDGSGLQYEAGDALGVFPSNCPRLVDEIIRALGFSGDESIVNSAGAQRSMREALLQDFQITQISKALLESLARHTTHPELARLLDPAKSENLQVFLHGREVIDVVTEFKPHGLSPAEFVAGLRKVQPRLYSISSSPKAHPGEVHLTVAVVRYETFGRARKGVCSTFLAERVEAETPVPIFVQTSHGFRLPADGDVPIIMIGPGTGIAPFRAFLEEREALGAKGSNWLFFGDQRRATDFLYHEEIEAMRARGVLNRLDLAFSRDQAEKCYVQHRIQEHAKEVWQWLNEGAHVYVCGDAKRMAKDVDAALRQVVETAGGKTAEESVEFMQRLKNEKRYQRDVY